MKTKVHNVKTFDTRDNTVITAETFDGRISISELYREYDDADGNVKLSEISLINMSKSDVKVLISILKGML